jgi:hypothetical protein
MNGRLLLLFDLTGVACVSAGSSAEDIGERSIAQSKNENLFAGMHTHVGAKGARFEMRMLRVMSALLNEQC